MNKTMQAKCDELIKQKDFPTPVELCLHARKEVVIEHNEDVFTQGFKSCYSKLEPVLRESLRCLREGKAQFRPNTTNSDVDVLIETLTEMLEE